MHNPKKLLSGFALYSLANFIHRGTVFITVPIFTRILSADDYGYWVIVLSLYAVMTILFDIGISRGVPRFYIDNSDSKQKASAFVVSTLYLRLKITTIFSVLAYFSAPSLSMVATGGKFSIAPVLIPVLWLSASESIISFVLAIIRSQEKPILYCAIRLVSTVLQVSLALWWVTEFSVPVIGMAWAYAVGSSVALLIALAWLVKSHVTGKYIKPDTSNISLLFYGLPLVFHDIATWIRNSSDPYIISNSLGLEQVAMYNVAMLSGLAIGVIAFSFDLAYAPVFFKMLKFDGDHGRNRASRLASIYFLAISAVSLIPILFSREIYGFIFTESYSEAALYSPIICVSYVIFVWYTIEIKPVFFQKKTIIVPFITLTPAVASILINYWAIVYCGLSILPWVWLICFLTMTFLARLASSRYDSIRFQWVLFSFVVMWLLGMAILSINASESGIFANIYFRIMSYAFSLMALFLLSIRVLNRSG